MPERDLVVSGFRHCVHSGDIELAAFVVMLDHCHALLGLAPHWTIGRWMHRFMSFVAGRTCRQIRAFGTDWEDSYYDTEVRTGRQFEFICDYIHLNPVREGYVSTPQDWAHSSAHPDNAPWASGLVWTGPYSKGD